MSATDNTGMMIDGQWVEGQWLQAKRWARPVVSVEEIEKHTNANAANIRWLTEEYNKHHNWLKEIESDPAWMWGWKDDRELMKKVLLTTMPSLAVNPHEATDEECKEALEDARDFFNLLDDKTYDEDHPIAVLKDRLWRISKAERNIYHTYADRFFQLQARQELGTL